MQRAVVLLLVCACGRLGFDPLRQSGDGGGDDGSTGDARADAAPLGPFGPFTVNAYQSQLTSPQREYGATMSDDGLEAYWSTYRAPSTGGSDIWRATRLDRQSTFGTPEHVDNLSGTIDDGEPTLSRDGRTLYLQRNSFLYFATRPDASVPGWSTAALLDPGGNLPQGFVGADIGPDDLRLVVSQQSTNELFELTRPDRSSPWGVPQLLPGLGGFTGDGYPAVRIDGLEIFWESARVPPQAIWYATRPSLDQPFGAPQRLALGSVDTFQVGDPDITADGCTLVFVSTAAGTGEYDVWTAERAPL